MSLVRGQKELSRVKNKQKWCFDAFKHKKKICFGTIELSHI